MISGLLPNPCIQCHPLQHGCHQRVRDQPAELPDLLEPVDPVKRQAAAPREIHVKNNPTKVRAGHLSQIAEVQFVRSENLVDYLSVRNNMMILTEIVDRASLGFPSHFLFSSDFLSR